MGSVRFKLQNLVIQNNVANEKDQWMTYRGDHLKYNKLQSANTLEAGQFVEFFTYFNTIRDSYRF